MNCKSIAFAASAALVLAATAANAADIAFTGGSDGSSRDLSLAANWDGGALPSASGDMGIVDVATFGGSYNVSANATLDGLQFANASANISIDGSGTLSLGAGGFMVDAKVGITLRAPMAVTAASTWSFGNGLVSSYASISGTADLAVNDWSELHFRNAPGYGGKMTLAGQAARSIIHVWQGAAWANTVAVSKGAVVWQFEGSVPFSTIIPGRSLTHTPWSDVSFGGTGTLVLEDGDTFTTSGDYHQIASGGLEIAGGSYTAGAAFIMGDNTGTVGWNRKSPASLLVSGGSFNGNQFNLGAFTETNRLVRQTGGTATMCTYHVGGYGDFSGTVPVMEYRLEGGTIQDKNGAARDRGLIMGGTVPSANPHTPAGIFTQTGGQAVFARLYWGAKGGFYTWDDTSTIPNGRAYGLIDLRGGDFVLPSAGFEITPMWNAGAVSNSTYDIRLSGGRITTRDSVTIPLAMTVESGDGPSTWDTGANNVLVSAPVDGEGTLRKAGTGRLQLTDAARFKGAVAVDEGVLEVRGAIAAPAGYTEGQNLYVFSADSLAGSLSDGDSVTSWTDSTGTLSCQKPGSGEISSPTSWTVPTFKPNLANGHAGLYFDNAAGSVLGFHSADNPLAGETNFSFVIVFRPTTKGAAQGGSAYASRCIIGNDRAWSANGPNTISLLYTDDYRTTLYMRNNYPDAGGLSGRTYLVPKPYQGCTEGEANLSVAVVSMIGNKVIYNFNNSFTNRTFETITDFNPRFKNGNTKYPLYFGTSDVDGTGFQQVRCFGGYIYEARFYKGRALNEAETRSVMDELSRKYYDASRADGYLLASNGSTAANFADTRTAPATPAADADWTPEFMDATFGAWDANYNKPTLVTGACNGRSALRFDAARNTVLKIPQGDNQDPLAGCYQFAIAIVFRTTTEGTGLHDATVGTGLYSSMLAGYGHNSGCGNAAVTFREYGAVGGYMASNYYQGSLVNPRKPCRLNDGLPHVAVFTGDSNMNVGTYRLMVDGVFTENKMSYGTPWPGYDSSRPHVIGALRAGVGHFTGDIMGITFWKSYLTEDEMFAICQKAACDYGFNLKERRAFTVAEMTTRGIAATNYTVAAGATLRMPYSATAPLTVGPGTTFSGAGAFEGSYRFANGGVADFAGVTTAMEDVQVADGGVMKFGAGATLPVSGANISSVSGHVVVDVAGSPAMTSGRPHTLLMDIDADRIAAGTEFSVIGASRGAAVSYSAEQGGLVLDQNNPFVMTVR